MGIGEAAEARDDDHLRLGRFLGVDHPQARLGDQFLQRLIAEDERAGARFGRFGGKAGDHDPGSDDPVGRRLDAVAL